VTRIVRAVALSAVTLAVVVASLTGCGAGHTVLGIHEAPKANPAAPALTVARANAILTRAFGAAYQGDMTTGAVARAAQRTAYTGEGLRAVGGRVKLADGRPTAGSPPYPRASAPRLLAVSRGLGYPRVIVAQTVTAVSGLPILHLLISPDPATPYRIRASVTMLSPSPVSAFDALSQGSPMVTSGTGLAVAPTVMLTGYAAGMAFPARALTNPPFGADSFSAQLRTRAAGVARAVAAQATFSQVHKLVPGSVYAVRQASGDGLAFGVLERTDSFAVKSGQAINTVADKDFVLMSGRKRVTERASRTTLEFIAFSVPRSRGQATLVAASEQVVAGSGS
jgi:hypothetical protein